MSKTRIHHASLRDRDSILSVASRPKNYQTGVFESPALDTIAALQPISTEGLAVQLTLEVRHVREILAALEGAGKIYAEGGAWYTTEEEEGNV